MLSPEEFVVKIGETLATLSIQELLMLRSMVDSVIKIKTLAGKTVRQIAAEENELPEIPKDGPAVEGLAIPVITKIEELK